MGIGKALAIVGAAVGLGTVADYYVNKSWWWTRPPFVPQPTTTVRRISTPRRTVTSQPDSQVVYRDYGYAGSVERGAQQSQRSTQSKYTIVG